MIFNNFSHLTLLVMGITQSIFFLTWTTDVEKLNFIYQLAI